MISGLCLLELLDGARQFEVMVRWMWKTRSQRAGGVRGCLELLMKEELMLVAMCHVSLLSRQWMFQLGLEV